MAIKQLKNSLALKLMAPVLLSVVIIIGITDFIIFRGSQQLFDQYVELQSSEYVESFLIATEVSSSEANIIRVTNSIGAYSDIKDIFIIDNQSQTILAANKGRFIAKAVNQLPDYYDMAVIADRLLVAEKHYQTLANDLYLVAYGTHILAEDRASKKPITILMLMQPQSIDAFFTRFKEQVFNTSVFVFLFALVVFYLLLKMLLLDPIRTLIATLRRDDETKKPVLCDIDSDDELGLLAQTYNDMSQIRYQQRQELVAQKEVLEDLSQHDVLTGISNRGNFDRVLAAEWRRSIRNKEAIALIMVDIDHFKEFNDQYGHQAGDDCLKIVAKALHDNIKRPGDLLSRYGGEEFVFILPNSKGNAWMLAESCRKRIKQLMIFSDGKGERVRVTISSGVAIMQPQQGQDQDSLIKAADMALYQAKARGRNSVVIHDETGNKTTDATPSNVMLFKKLEQMGD